jgi:hypothetical protein
MKRPQLFSVCLGIIPFIGMCFSVFFWDRIDPRIVGLPFNLFWLLAWIPISSGCMALANYVEERESNNNGDHS